MESSKVVIEAPFSFTGSAKRLWSWSDVAAIQWLVILPAIFGAWCLIAGWYLCFGFFVVPFRLIRRSSRKQKRDRLRHEELLSALVNK